MLSDTIYAKPMRTEQAAPLRQRVDTGCQGLGRRQDGVAADAHRVPWWLTEKSKISRHSSIKLRKATKLHILVRETLVCKLYLIRAVLRKANLLCPLAILRSIPDPWR